MTQAHKRNFERVKKDPWFILATDPYHDYSVPIAGLPDTFGESTTAQMVNDFHTIVAPVGLLDGETWDAHVFTLPVNTSFEADVFFDENNYLYVADLDARAGVPMKLGTVNVVTVKSGIPTLPVESGNGIDWAAQLRESYAFSGTDSNGIGMSRVIAGGYEVHNDTASLYKNGSVTSYSMPQGESQPGLVTVGTDTSGTIALTSLGTKTVVRQPPNIVGDARVLRNAQTWEAAEGVYCPFRLDINDPSINFRPVSSSMFEMRTSDISTYYNADRASGCNVRYGTQPMDDPTQVSMAFAIYPVRRAPIETTGSYFTGLSKETVLTLTTRIFLENAPTAANKQLLTTASPPAKYDPMVLQCYVHCLNDLKPAVPVKDNVRGDLWRSVLKTLLKIQPNVLGAAEAAAPEYGALIQALSKPTHMGLELALKNSEARAKARAKASPKGKKQTLAIQDARRRR